MQDSETIDFDNDPDELCPIIDEETRTLFNVDGYVKIGENIISKQEWETPEGIFADCCAWLLCSKYTFDYNDDPFLYNRQVRAKICIKSGLVSSTLKGKIKHYRKVDGKYKKRRADMRLSIRGISFNGRCVEMPQVWSAFKGYKKRKKRKVKARIWKLWREALVCSDDSNNWASKRCGLAFFVDDDVNSYALYLGK